MRRVCMFLFAVVVLTMISCHRKYEVIHARVPEDTLKHDDISKTNDNQQELMDEPLIDVPDIPQEGDYQSVGKASSKDCQEFDNLLKGQ